MIVSKLDRKQFEPLQGFAHQISFNEIRPDDLNTFTFALTVHDQTSIYAYATIIEMDRETAYMQHGGAMPNVKGTTSSKRCYGMIVDYLKARYKRISTRIQNKNVPMIKFALSEGLIIDGCFLYGKDVFLSLGWGFSHE